ncbi:unnamed protein product [Heligmosomoides polygyrus]|uniref:G_PROTEIN_RECEP_F1_2 domain-containing protein n=1 Tax=Heligmosomoides polygyrus TaxID=6339 RepID=A0A183G306_HELPZ|nr:unnamed protein product [Heligmosomoides polygyrus]
MTAVISADLNFPRWAWCTGWSDGTQVIATAIDTSHSASLNVIIPIGDEQVGLVEDAEACTYQESPPGILLAAIDRIPIDRWCEQPEVVVRHRWNLVVVLVVLLGMCHCLIVLPVVFAALPFKETRVSQKKPHLLTIMDKKTRVGHQASHA